MKRFAFFVLLVGLCTTLTLAQNRGQGRGRVTVSGTVIDKEDNSPIMQATVQLLSLPDSTMAVGNVSVVQRPTNNTKNANLFIIYYSIFVIFI